MKQTIALLATAMLSWGQGTRIPSPATVAATGSSATINGVTGSSTARGSITFNSTGVTVFNTGNVGLKVFDTTGNTQVKDSTTDQGYAFYVNGNIFAQGNITCSGSCGGGSSGYNTIQDEGIALTARTVLNFTGAGITCVDATTKTTCDVPAGGGSTPPFVDSTDIFYKSGDATAIGKFSAINIPAGTTRTYTVQNGSYTLAGTNFANTFTSIQSFGNVIQPSTTGINIGTTAQPFADQFFKQTYSENFRITRPGTTFGESWQLAGDAGQTNYAKLLNTAGTVIQSWACATLPCGIVLNGHTIPGASNLDLGRSGSPWGSTVTNALTISGITGSTQLLQVNSSGQVSGAGTLSSFANTALSNLATTSINTGLFASSDLPGYGLGDAFTRWSWVESAQFISRSSSGSVARCRLTSAGFACFTAANVDDTNIAATGGTLRFAALAGGGSGCVANDNSGNLTSVACSFSGANTALSNLSSPAVNTHLLPAGTNTINLGGASNYWNTGFINNLTSSSQLILVGTTSGTSYPLRITDTSTSPGINFYRSTSILSGNISSGSTAAFGFADSTNTTRMVIFQGGDVQVGSTSDQGYKFYVNGNVGVNGNLAVNTLTIAGASGLTTTAIVRNSAGTGTCAMGFNGGMLVASTC